MKVAYSGAQGTGKSTSVFTLSRELKMKHPTKSLMTLTENASLCPLKINKEGSEMTQLWIFSDQMSREIELQHRFDILVCDRTVIDGLAYGKYNGFDTMVEAQFNLAKNFVNTYDTIYFKTIKNNDYLFHDGIRDASDRDYRQKVEDYMLDYYKRLLDEGCTFKLEII